MKPWSNLTPREFEEFCYTLLDYNKFKNLTWYGEGGGDKGRDILCSKVETPIDGVEVTRRWVVQCKHYLRARVTKALLQEWLAATREHHPDRVLLIVSNTLSAGTKDWLKSVADDHPFDIHVWEEADLARQYAQFGTRLAKRFPKLPKVPRRVWLYASRQPERMVVCNDFDEVGFVTWNCDSDKEAMRAVRDFIEFIKANDFKYDGLGT